MSDKLAQNAGSFHQLSHQETNQNQEHRNKGSPRFMQAVQTLKLADPENQGSNRKQQIEQSTSTMLKVDDHIERNNSQQDQLQNVTIQSSNKSFEVFLGVAQNNDNIFANRLVAAEGENITLNNGSSQNDRYFQLGSLEEQRAAFTSISRELHDHSISQLEQNKDTTHSNNKDGTESEGLGPMVRQIIIYDSNNQPQEKQYSQLGYQTLIHSQTNQKGVQALQQQNFEETSLLVCSKNLAEAGQQQEIIGDKDNQIQTTNLSISKIIRETYGEKNENRKVGDDSHVKNGGSYTAKNFNAFHNEQSMSNLKKIQSKQGSRKGSNSSNIQNKRYSSINSSTRNSGHNASYFKKYIDDLEQVFVGPNHKKSSFGMKNQKRQFNFFKNPAPTAKSVNRRGKVPLGTTKFSGVAQMSQTQNNFGQAQTEVASLALKPQIIEITQEASFSTQQQQVIDSTSSFNQEFNYQGNQKCFKPSRIIHSSLGQSPNLQQQQQQINFSQKMHSKHKRRSVAYDNKRQGQQGATLTGVKVDLKPKAIMKKCQDLVRIGSPLGGKKKQSKKNTQDSGIGVQADFDMDLNESANSINNYASLNNRKDTIYRGGLDEKLAPFYSAQQYQQQPQSIITSFENNNNNVNGFVEQQNGNSLREDESPKRQGGQPPATFDTILQQQQQEEQHSYAQQQQQQRTTVDFQSYQTIEIEDDEDKAAGSFSQAIMKDYNYNNRNYNEDVGKSSSQIGKSPIQIGPWQAQNSRKNSQHDQVQNSSPMGLDAGMMWQTQQQFNSNTHQASPEIQDAIAPTHPAHQTHQGALFTCIKTVTLPIPVENSDIVIRHQNQSQDQPQTTYYHKFYKPNPIKIRTAQSLMLRPIGQSQNELTAEEIKRMRKTLDSQFSLQMRPNTVLSGPSKHSKSMTSKEMRFVPRTTMQIKAMQMKNKSRAGISEVDLRWQYDRELHRRKMLKHNKNKTTLGDQHLNQQTLYLDGVKTIDIVHNRKSKHQVNSYSILHSGLDSVASRGTQNRELEALKYQESNVTDEQVEAIAAEIKPNLLLNKTQGALALVGTHLNKKKKNEDEILQDDLTLRMASDSVVKNYDYDNKKDVKVQNNAIDVITLNVNSDLEQKSVANRNSFTANEALKVKKWLSGDLYKTTLTEHPSIENGSPITKKTPHLTGRELKEDLSLSQDGSSSRKHHRYISQRHVLEATESKSIKSQSQATVEQGRRSVFQRSFHRESTGDREKSQTNSKESQDINNQFNSADLEVKNQIYNEKSNQSFKPTFFDFQHLNRLKTALKSQAYLDDLRYQIQIRSSQISQQKNTIPKLMVSQKEFLNQFSNTKQKSSPSAASTNFRPDYYKNSNRDLDMVKRNQSLIAAASIEPYQENYASQEFQRNALDSSIPAVILPIEVQVRRLTSNGREGSLESSPKGISPNGIPPRRPYSRMNPLEEVPCIQYSFHGSNNQPNNSLNASQVLSTKLDRANHLSVVNDGLESGTNCNGGSSTFKEVKRQSILQKSRVSADSGIRKVIVASPQNNKDTRSLQKFAQVQQLSPQQQQLQSLNTTMPIVDHSREVTLETQAEVFQQELEAKILLSSMHQLQQSTYTDPPQLQNIPKKDEANKQFQIYSAYQSIQQKSDGTHHRGSQSVSLARIMAQKNSKSLNRMLNKNRTACNTANNTQSRQSKVTHIKQDQQGGRKRMPKNQRIQFENYEQDLIKAQRTKVSPFAQEIKQTANKLNKTHMQGFTQDSKWIDTLKDSQHNSSIDENRCTTLTVETTLKTHQQNQGINTEKDAPQQFYLNRYPSKQMLIQGGHSNSIISRASQMEKKYRQKRNLKMSNELFAGGNSKSISVSSQRFDYEDSRIVSDININNITDQNDNNNNVVIQEAYFQNEVPKPNRSKIFPRKQYKLKKSINQSTQGHFPYNNDLKNLTEQQSQDSLYQIKFKREDTVLLNHNQITTLQTQAADSDVNQDQHLLYSAAVQKLSRVEQHFAKLRIKQQNRYYQNTLNIQEDNDYQSSSINVQMNKFPASLQAPIMQGALESYQDESLEQQNTASAAAAQVLVSSTQDNATAYKETRKPQLIVKTNKSLMSDKAVFQTPTEQMQQSEPVSAVLPLSSVLLHINDTDSPSVGSHAKDSLPIIENKKENSFSQISRKSLIHKHQNSYGNSANYADNANELNKNTSKRYDNNSQDLFSNESNSEPNSRVQSRERMESKQQELEENGTSSNLTIKVIEDN